jgi:hypothetical protein
VLATATQDSRDHGSPPLAIALIVSRKQDLPRPLVSGIGADPDPDLDLAAIGDFATLILQKALKDLVYGVWHRSLGSPRNHPEHPYTAGRELRALGMADAETSVPIRRLMRSMDHA